MPPKAFFVGPLGGEEKRPSFFFKAKRSYAPSKHISAIMLPGALWPVYLMIKKKKSKKKITQWQKKKENLSHSVIFQAKSAVAGLVAVGERKYSQ